MTGPSPLARALGCPAPCECDVVVHIDDARAVGSAECVWTLEDPTFVHRYIWVGGYPHIALEDLEKLREEGVRETVRCLLEALGRARRVL